jgi:hypothetical protein
MEQLLRAHGIGLESAEIKLSPMLELDTKSEQFVGPGADMANRFLKREYRPPFVVPDIAS